MIGPLAPRVEDAGPPGPASSAREPEAARGGRRWPRRRVVVGVLVVVAVLAFALSGRLDLDGFHAWMKRLPAPGVAAVIGFLPLVGFPISALHLAAGLRFEFAPALAIVAGATLAQHVVCWLLVRALPRRFFARLEPWRKKLAGAGYREAAVLCCLLPGMPYTVQLYLLPVIGAPLRVLCLVSVPLHTARATVTILLGTISDDLSAGRVVALVGYYLVVFTACALALRRLRRVLAGPEAGGAAVP